MFIKFNDIYMQRELITTETNTLFTALPSHTEYKGVPILLYIGSRLQQKLGNVLKGVDIKMLQKHKTEYISSGC